MSNHDPSLDNSKVMYPSEQGNLELSHALIPAQPSAMPELPAMPGYGVGIPQGPEITHGPFNQTWLLNCLRRRWLPAAFAGCPIRRAVWHCVVVGYSRFLLR